MEDLQGHSAADGLLGGEAAHSEPLVMEVDNGTDDILDLKMRTSVPDSSVPSPEEQARLVEELEADAITAGEQMYIISSK